MKKKPEHIAIIGGGVIGLSIGWQLLRKGAKVTLLERDEVGSHTSYVAAGMLAPYAEVGFEEIELMKLGQKSLQLYPEFLDQLAEDTDDLPTLDRCGTLMVGIDRDDTEQLRRLYDFREELELPVELMTGTAAREREPYLSPNVVSAVWLSQDAQIDNRKLLKALKQAFLNRGGMLYEQTSVDEIQRQDSSLYVGTAGEENPIAADAIVIAAGSWSGQLGGLPEKYGPLFRPEKGQIITLKQTRDCDLSCIVRSPRTYLVPKEDKTIRLGATSEDKGFDTEVTAGGLKYLLEYGWEVVPSIYDLPMVETIAGLRPAAKDNLPVIGPTSMPGVYMAGGHHRNGILLMPITAFEVSKEILDGKRSEVLHNFRPERFYE
ncbi:glycine oxidase ThiO [Fodinibius salsisoli]|uniref:Glycine oxidase ThiO n=1 Tax=Fodinibius salsisoli TaxID=2820877 RepID=A0ABT3PM69_9BACT|nr:glycine oxidase ThiO [Fodinibius salsisoli]MCW9706960.1 glycine oxidase ThiO [Fodinibius salsisoli]